MRRLLPLLILALTSPGLARADETPETRLDFARKLRERGFPQLSLEYLEKFRKEAPAGLQGQVLIETVRTKLSLAIERDPEQRATLYAAARKELTEFAAKNSGTAQADQARLDVARLGALEAQALLGLAFRQDNAEARVDYARRAKTQFIQVGQELDKVEATLADAKEKSLVRFERGKNLLDQASAYLPAELADPQINRKVAELVDAARKLFEEVEQTAGQDDQNAAVHLARAWLIRSYHDGGRPEDAKTKLQRVFAETAPEAREGQRVARYFNLIYYVKDPKVTIKEAPSWLAAYPAFRNTSEGYTVRYLLAKAYLQAAEAISKDPKNFNAKKLYDNAQREFASLAKTDYSEAGEANRFELIISLRRLGEQTPLEQMKTFEDCFLKARMEMAKAQETASQLGQAGDEKKAKALAEQRQAHLANVATALQRALKLADAKTPFQEVGEARYFLAYTFLLADDLVQATRVAEELARVKPPTKRSAAAAATALQAYATLFARTQQPEAKDRLLNLARFILEDNKLAWANDPATPAAHYQLAMLAEKERNLPDAIAHLEKVTPVFPSYTFAQCQLANFALRVSREAERTPKEREQFEDKALAALQRVPTLPAGADAGTSRLFFHAHLGQANILYDRGTLHLQKEEKTEASAKLTQMDQIVTGLKKQLDGHGEALDADTRDKVGFTLMIYRKLGRRGLADLAYRAGEYDKVLAPEFTGDVVSEVKKLAQDHPKVKLKDWKVTGELVGLALRAQVQKGNLAEAKLLVACLGKLTDDNEQASAMSVLGNLVQDLAAQVRLLKTKNDPRLAKIRDNFAGFLRELQMQPDFLPKKEQTQFLANCYSSLEMHAEAAELYKSIPAPMIDPKKKPSPSEVAELQGYWQSQFLYGRSLRLAKEFKEADAVLKRAASDPHSRSQFLAQKELLYSLEDQELYGSAATGWNKLMQTPILLRAFKDATLAGEEARKLKETYFDCYYQMTYCLMKYGQNQKDAAKRAKALEDAALYIARLEQNNPAGWTAVGPRFQALLARESELFDVYGKMKATLKPPTSK